MSRHKTKIITDTESFICENCGRGVAPPEAGTHHRNHCPHCLWSRHVDIKTGDRRSGCRGLMEPIAIWAREKKDWAVIHRCTKCGFVRSNRIAGDDNEVILFTLAARPLAGLPFPVESALNRIESESIWRKR